MSGKIYKHNPIIRGHLTDSSDTSIDETLQKIVAFEAFELDLFNAIYLYSQQNIWHVSTIDLDQHQHIHIRYSDVKKLLGIRSNDFKSMVLGALQKLKATDIVIPNYVFPNGTVYKNFHISAVADYAEEVNHDADVFTVQINPIMLKMIHCKTDGSFTLVDIKKTRRLTSKFAKRLYEWLSSMRQINKKVCVNLVTMNKILGMEEPDFRRANRVIKNSYDQLFSLLNFTYEYDRTKKEIVFLFTTKQ